MELDNLYGPTECSIGCIAHVVDASSDAEIPIGRPIANVCAVLLDEAGRLAPIGADDHFLELGGHSLVAIQLMARLRAALGGDLPLAWLRDEPTVRGLARAFEARASPIAVPALDFPSWAVRGAMNSR